MCTVAIPPKLGMSSQVAMPQISRGFSLLHTAAAASDAPLCPCLGVTWLGANEQRPAGSSDPAGNLSKRCAQTSPGLEEAAYALLAGGRWPFSGG